MPKKVDKTDAALAATTAIGAKGTYDARRLGKNLDRWDSEVQNALKNNKGSKQIDAVYDAYVKGGKRTANSRFLGAKSGNILSKVIGVAKKYDLPLDGKDKAGAAPHYTKFTSQTHKDLKQYMMDKGVAGKTKVQFTDDAKEVIKNKDLSFEGKLKKLKSKGLDDAAKHFNQSIGKAGGELISFPKKYKQRLGSKIKKLKGGSAAVAGLGALGLAVNQFTKNDMTKKAEKAAEKILEKTAKSQLVSWKNPNSDKVQDIQEKGFVETTKDDFIDSIDSNYHQHNEGIKQEASKAKSKKYLTNTSLGGILGAASGAIAPLSKNPKRIAMGLGVGALTGASGGAAIATGPASEIEDKKDKILRHRKKRHKIQDKRIKAQDPTDRRYFKRELN